MRALLYTEDYRLEVADVDVPEPSHDEVLVRVEAAGICGSDVHGVASRSPRRTPPLIMGHELAGAVVAAGGDEGLPLVGRFAAVNPQVPCRSCRLCRSGRENVCPNRQLIGGTRPGGFAEYVAVPARCVHVMDDGADPLQAAFAEPLATCVHALSFLPGGVARTVVVIGAGTIGLLAAETLRLAAVERIVLCDPDEGRREAARPYADVVAAPGELSRIVEELTAGAGADVTVDAVGVEVARRQSLELLSTGGLAIWLGMHSLDSAVPAFDAVVREQRVQGAFAYTDPEFATAARLLGSGTIRTGVSSRAFGIEASAGAFTDLLDGPQDYLKALITPNTEER
jgi:L-iditol 2-dehydrogenase